MALNFPNSPTLNQVYTDSTSGFSYQWNGTVWISFSAASSNQIRVLDDISASFNNSTLTFALTSGSTSISPPNKQSLIINLGGVIQDPSDDYSISGSNITFSTAPTNGLSFSGVSLGPAIPINTIPDGTVTSGSLTVAGLLSTTNLFVSGISTFVGLATHTGTIFGSNLSLTGIATATTFVGALTGTATTAQGLTGTPNITVNNVVASAGTFTNLTVNGTQTIINTTSLEVADKNIGIGSTSSPSDALADGAGITIYGSTNKTITWNNNSDDFAFSNGIDIKGAVETVSTGSTYDLGGGRVILECDARNGTVFTHDLADGIVGITSLKNFPATKNSATTFTILFTQNATGTANTTAATGIGTNIYLTPYGVSGFTTTSRVATASTITLSTTALDVDIVSFMVHYNGSGTGTVSNYKVYVTNNTGFRYGSVGF